MNIYIAWRWDTEDDDDLPEIIGGFDDFEKAKAACSKWGDVVSVPLTLNEVYPQESFEDGAAYWPDFEWLTVEELYA